MTREVWFGNREELYIPFEDEHGFGSLRTLVTTGRSMRFIDAILSTGQEVTTFSEEFVIDAVKQAFAQGYGPGHRYFPLVFPCFKVSGVLHGDDGMRHVR